MQANAALTHTAAAAIAEMQASGAFARTTALRTGPQADALGFRVDESRLRDLIGKPQTLTTVSERLVGGLRAESLVGLPNTLDGLRDIGTPGLVIARQRELIRPRTPRIVTPRDSELAPSSLSPLDYSFLWLIKASLSRDDVLWLLPNLVGDPLAVAVLACGLLLLLSGNPSLMALSTIPLGISGTDIQARIDRHRRGQD